MYYAAASSLLFVFFFAFSSFNGSSLSHVYRSSSFAQLVARLPSLLRIDSIYKSTTGIYIYKSIFSFTLDIKMKDNFKVDCCKIWELVPQTNADVFSRDVTVPKDDCILITQSSSLLHCNYIVSALKKKKKTSCFTSALLKIFATIVS